MYNQSQSAPFVSRPQECIDALAERFTFKGGEAIVKALLAITG